MRPKPLLLIAIPAVAVIALGGTSVVSSWRGAAADQRTETLASVSSQVNQLALEVEGERDAIIWYIAAGADGRSSEFDRHATSTAKASSAAQLRIVQQQESYAKPWVKIVTTSLARLGSGYSRDVQASAHAVTTALSRLPQLRQLTLNTQIPATTVLLDYGNLVSTLLSFNDVVARSGSDPQFNSTAEAMAMLARVQYEDSVQRAIVMSALTAGTINSNLLTMFNASTANQKADISEFGNFATPSQSAGFGNALAQSLADRVQADEQTFSQNANRVANARIVPEDWYGSMSDVISATEKFDQTLAASATDRARALHERAITSALVIGGIILAVLLFSLIFAIYVGRSMAESRRPLTLGEATA